MQQTKIILVSWLLIVLCGSSGFATSQLPDRLIYKGDTLAIFANPLEQLYENDSLAASFFGKKQGCESTACWRSYVAEWQIIENQLYLIGIYSCCFYSDTIQANLKSLFGNNYIDGKVKADWVSQHIIAPKGKLLYYIHNGYSSVYEKETEFQIEKGKLIAIHTYDNSKSKQSIYSQDSKKLWAHIYKEINWEKLPQKDLKNEPKVILSFTGNEMGVVDSVIVLRGYNELFDQEAIRVAKTIPEWDVYFRRGKFERRKWKITIFFSEEKREEYK